MVTGTMMSSKVVHLGKHLHTTPSGVKLYAPRCAKMRAHHNLTFLLISGNDVTCKKCAAWIAKYGEGTR